MKQIKRRKIEENVKWKKNIKIKNDTYKKKEKM